jgi:invasion protein IalB
MKRTILLFSSLATCLVIFASSLEAANDPRATQLTYESWMKLCIGMTCFVVAEARGACHPSGGGLAIVTDEKNLSLSVTLGTTRSLEGAIRVQIDQGDPILIQHPECNGLVCYGKVQIDSGLIERLKRSQTITIEASDTTDQKIKLSLSLADFAKAVDGPAAPPPKVFEETQGKLKEELARREEEQKKLQCEE